MARTSSNCTCTCVGTSKGCTPGSVFAGMIVGILITVLVFRGKWGWIKQNVVKRFRFPTKPKAVANASYEADFQFDGNAGNLLEQDNYQNVVISDDKEVNIADRPPSDEIPGNDEAVYAVSLKHVKKQAGLPTDMIQKIANLQGKPSKIVSRKSQEFEDYVDIEKNTPNNESLSRSATLPTSRSATKISDLSSTNEVAEKKSKSKKKKKSGKTAANAISPETQPEQPSMEQTSGVEPEAKTDYVMREASQNGEYFVLDKTFC